MVVNQLDLGHSIPTLTPAFMGNIWVKQSALHNYQTLTFKFPWMRNPENIHTFCPLLTIYIQFPSLWIGQLWFYGPHKDNGEYFRLPIIYISLAFFTIYEFSDASFDDNLKSVVTVLKRLQSAELTVNPDTLTVASNYSIPQSCL